MKPIGTITKFYPFMDDETREFTEETMRAAENYRDFAILFGRKVVSQESSRWLVYFAARFALVFDLFDVSDKLGEQYLYYDIIRPWILVSHFKRGDMKVVPELLEVIDNVLAGDPEDWLSLDMQLLRIEVLGPYTSAKPADRRDLLVALNKAEKVSTSRLELEAFTCEIQLARADILYSLGEHEKALEQAKMALEESKECDDQFIEAWILGWMAGILKNTDAKRAIELAGLSERIHSILGNLGGIASILNTLGLTYTILGETSEAIGCFRSAIKIRNSLGSDHSTISINLSRIYLRVGRAKEALKTIEDVIEKLRGHSAWAHLIMSQALSLIGRFDEAAEHLEIGSELAFRSGRESLLALQCTARGVFERETGDMESALHNFRQALQISEQQPFLIHTIPALIRLAELEVQVFSETNDRDHIETAQLLLSRLEQLAREQELQAVLVDVFVLKANLRKLEGQEETAHEILKKALEYCKSPELKPMIAGVEVSISHTRKEESRAEMTERFSEHIHSMAVPAVQAREIPFTILGCIMILSTPGLEIFSRFIDTTLIQNPAKVADLISAVSSFTRTLRKDLRGELQSIIHHEIAVLLEYSEHLTCALLSDKDTYDARVLQRRFLEQFEEEFSDHLAEFEGDVQVFSSADQIFERILSE